VASEARSFGYMSEIWQHGSAARRVSGAG